VRTQQRVHLVDEDDAGAELGGQAEQRTCVPHPVAQPASTSSRVICSADNRCANGVEVDSNSIVICSANHQQDDVEGGAMHAQNQAVCKSIVLGSTVLQQSTNSQSARAFRLQRR
jgi:hypothetical protein